MPPFQFTIHTSSPHSRARTGVFTTPHGDIPTPIFMPCGTKGTVKTMKPEELKEIGVKVLLGNTYHLYLRPGHEFLKEHFGGLHTFMNWDGPILTDSGGFQVFSLGGAFTDRVGQKNVPKAEKSLVKLTEDGVEFRSYIDGSKHFFSPEKVMEIEEAIGADIIMQLDECAPHDSTKSYAKEALDRTHRWAQRCVARHHELQANRAVPQALFPIVQGVLYDDLRVESAKFMTELDTPGIAIGGLSVGETKEEMYHVMEVVEPHLPKEKPRYVMGVGTPEDLLEGVMRGIDMFDCVLPTRLGRHGTFFTVDGPRAITNACFRTDMTSLDPVVENMVTQNYSRAYIHHLFKEKEILGMHLLTYHNLHFLLWLMETTRAKIAEGTFESWAKAFLNRYLKGK